ncbi:outer membrane protein OmpA-like peptidoglycan-associated protein [Aeromicrobium panaciterrae]|uniref:Outer membrane protein OmpA-like peptidoglycan-associated protein n=1 Tax=Aeromicrobium panaciterrae TaxID=363861 RepID=A0ABU1UQW6_9ACTN|nr:OmpA family protein [Aeromicrobium panaciterrae]MDR7087585.1 outer membrane protein OmpA-like peptidoglycan-associated protein [Aeromicrobium panaciterrae]
MTTPQTKTKQRAGLTGIALAAVIGIGSFAGSDSAADDLTPKAYAALVQAGLSNVKVDFDGREAKLSNGTPDELAKAEKIVEGVNGVRWAKIDSNRSTNLPDPPTFSLTRVADGVNLNGVVPNAAVAQKLKDAALSLGKVTGDLKIDPNVGTADWLGTLSDVIPSLSEVDDLALSVDGDSLAIGGSLESQAGVDTLADLIEPSLGDLSLDNTLKVDAARLSPSQAEDIKAANVYFARGSSTLDARGKAGLLTLVDVLKRNTGVELEIGGHAGPTDPVRGKALSDERVAAVKEFLVASGIDAARLSTKSYGSDPEADGDAYAEQYRRVDFIVKGN